MSIKKKNYFKQFRRAFVVLGRFLAVILSVAIVVLCNMVTSVNLGNLTFKDLLVKNLHDIKTYITSIAISISWAVVYWVVYMTCREKKLDDDNSKEIITSYKIANKTRPYNFADYIKKVENINRKKEAYSEMMEERLAKVQSKIEDIRAEDQVPETKHKFIYKRYLALKDKEKDIIYKSTDEYINTHILSLSVKYNRVKLSHFVLPDSFAEVTDKTESQEKKKLTNKLISKVTMGALLGLCGFSILTCIGDLFSWNTAGFWLTIVSVILSLFIQGYFASDLADTLVDSEILAPCKMKTKIIEDSLCWEFADIKGKPFQEYVNQFMEKEKEQLGEQEKPKETVKITQAQLEYLEKHREEINEQIINEEMKKGEDVNGNTNNNIINKEK